MSEALKLFLNKNNMGHLYNDILAKLDTIVQNETMMNDFCNAVISIIESNEKNLRKRKKPWSLSEKKYRLKNLFNTYSPTFIYRLSFMITRGIFNNYGSFFT